MLSGNKGQKIIKNLQIAEWVKPGIALLNIGIGTGICTRDYKKMRCNVYALDISDVAIAKVKDIVHGSYLASNLKTLPSDTFDLAISHLVAQHTEDPDLQANLVAVIASLKENGIYAIQFAYPLHNQLAKNIWTQGEAKAGSITRSLSQFAQMVESAGGYITRLFTIGVYPEYGLGWYGCHIQKQDVSA